MGVVGSREEWSSWFDALQPLAGIPWMPIIGNREFDTSILFGQFALPPGGEEGGAGPRWYSFEVGEALFLVLFGNDSRTFADQATWAAGVLAQSHARWRIAMIHQPPLSTGRHGSDARQSRPGPNGHSLLDVLEDGGVDLVLSGHDHFSERTGPLRGARFDGRRHRRGEAGRGPLYVVSGGAGAESYTPRPMAELQDRGDWPGFRKPNPDHGEDERTHPPFHFLRIQLQHDSLTLQAYEVDMAGVGLRDDGHQGLLDEVVVRKP
jgi:hypothetical protein